MVHDQMRLYVQITLPDIFYFLYPWKEGRGGRTLKRKEQYVKGKATKRCRKDAFRHCKHRKFSADVTMAVFMLEMFKSSQYDFAA